METVTIKLHQISYIPDIPKPVFRNRKDWRRYQVALKRLNKRIEAQLLGSILGWGFASEPTSYPLRRSGGYGGYILQTTS